MIETHKQENILIKRLVFTLLLCCFSFVNAANTMFYEQDSLSNTNKPDSLLTKDSTLIILNTKKLKNRVDYNSQDSIVFDVEGKNVYLYNKSFVQQKDIKLQSGYIAIDFDSSIIQAEQLQSSDTLADTLKQYPLFFQGETAYKSKQLRYNLDNGKGVINSMFTTQQEGFLHGDRIKKMNDSVLYVSGGTFTTCPNEQDPHFGINFSKAEIITDDKIVTGPAWFSIVGVPLPLGIPFGYFPLTEEQKSGLLMPTYGYASNRGYYLRNLGWYFAINDYLDLALQGDIYTNLSYAINAKSNYVKRYRYKGSFLVRYEENHTGLKHTDTWSSQRDFKLQWQHTQDSKAHPYRTFSANVNLVSAKYNQYTTSLSDYLTNTTTSSIAFSTRFGDNWNFTANLGESYNINTKYISLDLPSITLASSQFHPLKRTRQNGKSYWWDDITVSYRLSLVNSIDTYDSLLFKDDWYKKMSNGIQHYIPIQNSMKVLKYLNWTNSINYTERWYTSSTHKAYNQETGLIDKDTTFGFTANRDVNFSSSLNTRIYGMFTFKKGYLKAIRHVINPVLNFTFTPSFSSPSLGFYDYYIDKDGKKVFYSKTEDGVYGSPPMNRSGVINFTINNSLEAKVKSNKDTITGTQKLMLIENFALSTGYDLAKDSCNWQPLRISARTTLFNKLVINYSASFTPYIMDTNNNITNRFIWQEKNKLFQKQSSQWNLTFSWSLHSNKRSNEAEDISPTEMLYSPFVNNLETLPDVVDFSVPWNISLSGNFSRLSNYIVKIANYNTNKSFTLSATGDVSITSNWRVGFRTGYDFINKDFTYTSFDFYRDLHCWEMRFNWVPFGNRTGWNFTINVKASMLQDLKYEKRNDFRNRLEYN